MRRLSWPVKKNHEPISTKIFFSSIFPITANCHFRTIWIFFNDFKQLCFKWSFLDHLIYLEALTLLFFPWHPWKFSSYTLEPQNPFSPNVTFCGNVTFRVKYPDPFTFHPFPHFDSKVDFPDVISGQSESDFPWHGLAKILSLRIFNVS